MEAHSRQQAIFKEFLKQLREANVAYDSMNDLVKRCI